MIVYQGNFSSENCGETAEVKIYMPEEKTGFNEIAKRQLSHWASMYEIEFSGILLQKEAAGDDTLQAISIACEAVFKELSKRGSDWQDESDMPFWIVFPRTIPISWGKEFYDDIVEYISEANRKKNAEIEARRSRS